MSEPDLLDLYDRASAWSLEKVKGATDRLDDPTGCDEWNVRTLMNHMLETQRYFIASARGEKGTLSPMPPDTLGDDPVAAFEHSRSELLGAFRQPGVLEKTGPLIGIAFADQLLHGWDLATATGQDASMPAGLAEAAYAMINGRLTDEQRGAAFKPAVAVKPNASPQEQLLGYSGRDPNASPS